MVCTWWRCDADTGALRRVADDPGQGQAGLSFPPEKHLDHPEVGALELYCQTLLDGGSGQTLLVFTAAPGSASYGRLALLSILGGQLLETQP